MAAGGQQMVALGAAAAVDGFPRAASLVGWISIGTPLACSCDQLSLDLKADLLLSWRYSFVSDRRHGMELASKMLTMGAMRRWLVVYTPQCVSCYACARSVKLTALSSRVESLPSVIVLPHPF